MGYDMTLELDWGKSLGWAFVENFVEEFERKLALDSFENWVEEFDNFDLGSMKHLGDFSNPDCTWMQMGHSYDFETSHVLVQVRVRVGLRDCNSGTLTFVGEIY